MDRKLIVGEAIRRRRQELGYSQEGFAQRAGIERARYGRIERGEMNLTLNKLFELADQLEIEAWRLIEHAPQLVAEASKRKR